MGGGTWYHKRPRSRNSSQGAQYRLEAGSLKARVGCSRRTPVMMEASRAYICAHEQTQSRSHSDSLFSSRATKVTACMHSCDYKHESYHPSYFPSRYWGLCSDTCAQFRNIVIEPQKFINNEYTSNACAQVHT